MFTVVETSIFQKQWPMYWTEDERGAFAAELAVFPGSGVVVKESGGIRKVRWKRKGTGKSGGVGVIYFVRNEAEEVVRLLIYAKSEVGNIKGPALKEIRRAPKTRPLNRKDLAAFEAKRDLAAELLQSIREMKSGRTHVVLSPATEAREKTGLSQSQFATLLGVSVRTLHGWEQGRKQPSDAARTLLTIARTNSKALLAVAGGV